MLRLLAFLPLFLSFAKPAVAQRDQEPPPQIQFNWVLEARDQQVLSARDSAAARAAHADALRQELNAQLEELGFERSFIFGTEDRYFKEGMHREFTQEPKPMAVDLGRDPRVIALEENHVRLYQADRALFYWRKMADGLRAAKISPLISEVDVDLIQRKYARLPEAYRRALADPQLRQLWLQNQITCQVFPATSSSNYTIKPGEQRYKLNDSIQARLSRANRRERPVELRAEHILASYPGPGQFNFYRQESRQAVGYFVFELIPQALYEAQGSSHQLKIRWRSASGQSAYTTTSTDFGNRMLYFAIPTNFLERGQVYELALVLVPTALQQDDADREYCQSNERFFRQYAGLEPPTRSEDIEVLHRQYFRVSRYENVFDKLSQRRLSRRGDSLFVALELEEPLGDDELDAESQVLSFSLQELRYHPVFGAIYNRDLVYYLQVPSVSPVDTSQGAPITAALDHTLYSDFIYDLRLGNPGSISLKYDAFGQDYQVDATYTLPQQPQEQVFLRQSSNPPRIVAGHFDGSLPLLVPAFQAELYCPAWLELQQRLQQAQAMVRQRMEERAQYLFLIDTWRRKQLGEPQRLGLEHWRQQEAENLLPAIRALLDMEMSFPTAEETFNVTMRHTLPGTTQPTTVRRLEIPAK
jgi:hypothetical protein